MNLESFEITLNPNQKERPCGLRAKLNVYDDACDDIMLIDGQRMVYLYKDDVIPAETMNAINNFASSEYVCTERLLQDAIDTINHQDAIKEFAERLIDKVGFNSSIVDVYEYIDDLVKEMVGEQSNA